MTLIGSTLTPASVFADETDVTPPAESTTPPPPIEELLPPVGETTPPPPTAGSEQGGVDSAPPPPPPAEGAQSVNPPSETGEATIVTGDAGAGADAVNVVNTNTTNGGSVQAIAINDASSTDAIDLGSAFSTSTDPGDLGTATSTCSDCAESGSLAMVNENEGTITNNITVQANTGGNTASNACGDATIVTGNASAGANIINILNTNLIQSHLFAVTINKFGDWLSNLYLPGVEFFQSIANGLTENPSGLTITNTNNASVENSVATDAATGGNSASGNGTVVTGNANSLTTVANFINTNVLGSGGTSFQILLNIGGEWTGTIFSMPSGTTLSTNGGLISISGYIPPVGSSSGALSENTTVANTNNATIVNNVTVTSSTGGNTAVSADCGSAAVATGDARSAVNILNVANTNIIGMNWFIALINIAGNWLGNLAFGQPDLWLGETASLSAPAPVSTGYTITYNLTVKNQGGAVATNVVLEDSFNAKFLDVSNYGDGVVDAPGHIVWYIGSIAPGSSATRTYSARVTSRMSPNTTHTISNFSRVSLYEPDANMANNSESLSILGKTLYSSVGGAWPPELKIAKSNDANGPISAPGTVKYKIVVTNTGSGVAYGTYVVDALSDDAGNIVTESSWDLGELYPNEEVTIEYDSQFAEHTPSGTYSNAAYAEGLGGAQNGYVVRSNTATSKVEVKGVEPAVAGAEEIEEIIELEIEHIPPSPEFPVTENATTSQIEIEEEVSAGGLKHIIAAMISPPEHISIPSFTSSQSTSGVAFLLSGLSMWWSYVLAYAPAFLWF